jgi:predicted ATPase
MGCSPYHSNSSLYPVIVHLQRVLDWQHEDSAEVKLIKLEKVLQEFSPPLDEVVPLFAGMLSLQLPMDRYPPLNLMPQQQKQQTLDAVVAWLLEEAERRPVVQVWEDLHWADPSTLELLTLEMEQLPTVPILNVLTFRPGFTPPWPQRSHMTPVTLNRLERPEVEVLIAQQANGKALPREVVEHIVGKTDGIPLYVEELTKAILEADFLLEGNDSYELTGSLAEVTIPATLQDSLMARLDRLPSIREVAQVGAVLGREFAYEMIQAILSNEEAKLHEGLEQLVDAELLYQRGRPPRARYLFKHALVQDVAYQSLLRRTRRYYHRQVAELMENKFPETVMSEPELVAHHYTEAGLAEKAIPYWQQAGERAASSWTNEAAANHFQTAIDTLMTLPESRDRDEVELTIRLALGGALQKTKGMSGDESVESNYVRSNELSQHVGGFQQRLAALFGQWRYFIWQSRLETSRDLADQLLEVAERTREPSDLMLANYAMAATVLLQGEVEAAFKHLEVAASIYDTQFGATIAYRLGHDPRVTRLSSTSWVQWLRGFPAKAKIASHEAVAIADELQDPLTLALANDFAALACDIRREYELMAQHIDTAQEIADEHGFANWAALARIHKGSLLVHRGELESGIESLQEGIDDYEATHQTLFLSYYFSRLAECIFLAGRFDDALLVLESALNFSEETGERWWDAEIHRLKGTVTAEIGADIGAAEACFHRALEIARHQEARSLELRAATALAKLWCDQNRMTVACDLLAPVYNWFTEGFDTPDLKDAKMLLDELT